MSGALAKASSLKAEIRLAQAVSVFEADLSNEQKSTFRRLRSQSLSETPSPYDVMQLTAEVDRHTSEKFSSACFGPRFTNFLYGVQQYAALGDVVVGGSQNLVACGVWSLVRMSLLSIVNLSTYIEKLSLLFMDAGRSAPRDQAIALLYPQSRRLQSRLIEYFVVVVGLCHYLFKFGQKSTLQRFASSLSDAHLKTFQTDLNKWASLIREEIVMSEAQKSSSFKALIRDVSMSASHQQKHATKMRVLDFCSTYDHDTAWKQIRKVGNASSHMQQLEYQDWRDGSGPSTLLYTGKPGSGKSVLMANIVDDLSLCTGSRVAYFFCKHDAAESLQARTIIGSLARQLLRTVPDLDVLAKSCENAHTTSDTNEILDMLLQGYLSNAKVYFVLDGLDECNSKEKETVVQALQKIQEKRKILVCASFREEPNNSLQSITNQLLASRVVLIPDDKPDIKAFIKADLDRCISQERLTIRDPTLILDIQDALLKGSQGMFLWVALQIESLCRMETDHAIREALVDLPRDLSETFDRILRRSGSLNPALQTRTLQLVLAACRPLTTEELREALSVISGDATWDPSRVLNDVYSALACCGGLLIVDEEELTVHFVHPSVKQYMLNGSRFSPMEAQRMLADAVVTYLGYGVFGTELSKASAHPLVAQSAPSKIVQATTGSSGPAQRLAIKLLRARQQPDFDISRAIVEARSSLNSKPEHPFRFYAYANTYWQDHVLYASGSEAAILNLTSKLIYSRASELNKIDKNFWKRFQWAAAYGNGNILALLLQAGEIDMNAKDDNEMTPLMRAAQGGWKDTVEVLLSVGKADVEAKDHDGRTALMLAAGDGHEDTVEVLLSVGKADVEAKDNNGWTALMRAAQGGHKNTVEVLLSVGKADISPKNRETTPVGEAAQEHVQLPVLPFFQSERIVSVLEWDGNSTYGGPTVGGDESIYTGQTLIESGVSETSNEKNSGISYPQHTRKDDDIRSIISEEDDNQSQISTSNAGRSRDIENAIVSLLAANSMLTPIYEKALELMPRERFADNFGRILRTFHMDLKRLDRTLVTQELAASLRSKEVRNRIARKITDRFISNQEPLMERDLQRLHGPDETNFSFLEAWLTRSNHPLLPEESIGRLDIDVYEDPNMDDKATISAKSNHEEDDSDVAEDEEEEGRGGDVGEEGRDYARNAHVAKFPRLDLVVQNLVECEPFQDMVARLKEFLLPTGLLRDISPIPRENITYESNQSQGILNAIQGLLEDLTGLEWDWWPLPPPMRPLNDGETRVFWRCLCGAPRWRTLRSAQKHILMNILKEPPRPFQRPLSCVSHQPPIIQTDPYLGSALAAGNQPQDASLPSSSGNTPAAVPSLPTTINSTLPLSGGPAPPQTSRGTFSRSSYTASSQNGYQQKQPLWFIFKIEGARSVLDWDQFGDDKVATDCQFQQQLRERHNRLRGRLRLWFSYWRLSYWEFVKLQKTRRGRLVDRGIDLPETVDYVYSPRPPKITASDPWISRHEFEEMVKSCITPCWLGCLPTALGFHDCDCPDADATRVISAMPKRETEFMINSSNTGEDHVWGIHARYVVSAFYVFCIHMAILAITIGIWIWWQRKHPDDLQGASVPLTVAGICISTFWASTGILKGLR